IALSAMLFLTIIAAAQSGKFTVQIVAVPSQAEAEVTLRELKANGIEAYILKSQIPGKGTFYRVRAGIFSNANDARKYGETLKQQSIVPEFFIAPYERPTAAPVLTAPAPAAAKEEAKPVKTAAAPVTKEPAKTTAPVKEPPKETAANNTKPSSVKEPPPPVASSATSVSFAQFKDPQIGFTFDYPAHWAGNPLTSDAAQAQRVNAGAYFQSVDDNAFLNVIWNELDKANNPANNNDLIVDVILTSMKSGKETQKMEAASRRVEEVRGQIKTFLDLRATFQMPGQNSPLDFLGKALIIRANKGILLVAVFYSKDAPATVPGLADKVIASVKTPE
ncbi:MAG: SPOR domain-containing protein, partial [Acidobacteriota bacterium]